MCIKVVTDFFFQALSKISVKKVIVLFSLANFEKQCHTKEKYHTKGLMVRVKI